MREDRPDNMVPWVGEEAPRNFMPNKPLMLDKATDTSLDEESFKLVPCTCRIGDVDSDTSCISQTTAISYKTSSILRECFCSKERGKTLLDAVFTANFDLLEICLDHNVDVNYSDESGDTVLHMVSDRGDLEMLSFLLTLKNININAQNQLGLTPLSVAIMSARDEAAEFLLDRGADPNIPDIKGRTPICFSVHLGNETITKMLIDHHADVNIEDAFGNTPIQEALSGKPTITMVKVLLSSGANPLQKTNTLNPFLETVLDCTNYEKLELVKVLVESGVDVDILEPKSNRNCLHLAGINGFLPLAEYLVKSGADLEQLDMSGRSPDRVALEHDNLAVADFFLKAKCLRRIFFKERVKDMSKSLRKLTMAAMFSSSTKLMRSDHSNL
ncbi:serine/threonine-protein phosphatase 6 regulatory ankyrin repeat subunit A-like isoform X2 [Coccinella septempunctata]|uniref:serine/threonine-protein phosphatase 6 regulatory ankyrin repeat subunit A-like isoform X2 n=1 Tax=Coccinella septempunctata TaxID=41139 RepID=UPI001D09851E|nr:serine/threonine-protein phosphatase 6 regulatory ankyrin repeat subunit A-like isoform X2 [Coccinella septempunctata]